MENYEAQFQNLSDSEIHNLNRNIKNSAELEFAINNSFLNQLKYNDEEIIENIKQEVENSNVFSIMTMACWYREGTYVEQSDKKYIDCLQRIVHVKTQRLDAQKFLKSQKKNVKHQSSNNLLYGEILHEASIQLGQHYSSSTDKRNLKIAKKFFEQSKIYAPAIMSTVPLLGLSTKALGLIVAKQAIGLGAIGLIGAGIAGPVAAPIAGVAGAIAVLTGLLSKNRKSKHLHKPALTFTKKATPPQLERKEQKDISVISPDEIVRYDFGNLWNQLTEISQKSISTAYKNYYQNKEKACSKAKLVSYVQDMKAQKRKRKKINQD